jgi:hypothetical protein
MDTPSVCEHTFLHVTALHTAKTLLQYVNVGILADEYR